MKRDPHDTNAGGSPACAQNGNAAGRAEHGEAELMLEHYVCHVLVEDEGVLVGVVSARDLLGEFASGH